MLSYIRPLGGLWWRRGRGLAPYKLKSQLCPYLWGDWDCPGRGYRPCGVYRSALQTPSVQDEVLAEWEAPIIRAMAEARASFSALCPQFDWEFLDEGFLESDVQRKLSTLRSNQPRLALPALLAQERIVDVLESAAQPHASGWLQALPVERMGLVMSNIEFRCRLRYQLLIPMFQAGSPCPRCGMCMIRWGDHAVQCRVGRGVANIYRHNAVRYILFRVGKEVETVVVREPPLPVRVLGFEARRPDLMFQDWEGGRDLYIDVVGTSPLPPSYGRGGARFVPGGAGARAAAGKLASDREILLRQPPRLVFRPFSCETLGGLGDAAEELLSRLQGLVNQAVVAHEDLVWFSVQRRVSFVIARAVGRQLASRFPCGG
eukprot:jgi/Botrbrau1/15970/Bobra.0294s0008.1